LLVNDVGLYEDGMLDGLPCLCTGITMEWNYGCGITPV